MVKPDNQNAHEISWEASEYVHNEKGAMWFLFFGIGSVLVLALTYLILKDIFSIIVVGMMISTIVIFANRKPTSVKYALNDEGVSIGTKNYGYGSFKSFSITDYGAVESVYLEPLERFMPPISIFFPSSDGDRIVTILGQYLPHRDRQPDFIDRLVHRMRL